MRCRLLLSIAALVLSAGAYQAMQVRASAAGAAIVMVYGEPLPEPVFFVNDGTVEAAIGENSPLRLLRGTLVARPADLNGREFLRVAMFFGFRDWSEQIENADARRRMRPEQANQHGRLYPATATSPAFIVKTRATRTAMPVPVGLGGFETGERLSAEAVRALIALGLPVGPARSAAP